MTDFATVFAAWPWADIRGCPGRFVLKSNRGDITASDLFGDTVDIREYRSPAARDPVLVARFADGGWIAYRHRDGSVTHTLNTADGFARKLAQLGIDPAAIANAMDATPT
jgi:hypothetical protein